MSLSLNTLRRIQRLLVVVFALASSYPIARPALGVLALDRAQAYLTYGHYDQYVRLMHVALTFNHSEDELNALGDNIALNTNASAADRQLFEHALETSNDPNLWWDESIVAMREHNYERACTALSRTTALNNPTLEHVASILSERLGRSCR